jgi:O-antigen ligase
MGPSVALIICTAFVLFLLILERKETPEVSLALWLPTIWMLVIASKPLGIWFHSAGGADIESGSLLDQIFLLSIFLIGIIILFKRTFSWFEAIKNNRLSILVISFMLLSIVWSEVPFISIKRWTKELIALVMAFVVLSEVNPIKSVESIFRKTIYVLIPFSYLVIHYYPEYGRMYGRWSGELMWVGMALQKNSLGRLCIFSAFFLLWGLLKRRAYSYLSLSRYHSYVEVFILFLTLWLMGGPEHVLTYSATSSVSLLLAIICFFWLLWKKKRGSLQVSSALIVIAALTMVYGIITPFVGGLALFDVSSTLGREETLTGRSQIWETLIPYVFKEPIVGYGFGGFWTNEMREIAIVGHAHNGYLDMILSLGFVGLGLLCYFFLSCMRKALEILEDDFYLGSLWICCLIIVVIHNIAESSFSSFSSHLTAVILFLSVSSSKSAQNSNAK